MTIRYLSMGTKILGSASRTRLGHQEIEPAFRHMSRVFGYGLPRSRHGHRDLKSCHCELGLGLDGVRPKRWWSPRPVLGTTSMDPSLGASDLGTRFKYLGMVIGDPGMGIKVLSIAAKDLCTNTEVLTLPLWTQVWPPRTQAWALGFLCSSAEISNPNADV